MFKKIILSILILLIFAVPSFAKGDDIVVKHTNGIYIFKIPLKKYANKIKPYVAPELTTATDVFNNKDLNFKLVVNGGFFDIKTGAPVSEVVIDKEKVQSLFDNEPLVQNLSKQGRVEKVLNRTEFRVLEDYKKNLSFDISEHFEDVETNTVIKHSLQAGPMLLPSLRLEEESFINYDDAKVVQIAADVLKRRERTIIGLKQKMFKNDSLYIIIFTKNHKADLKEARIYCEKLGLNKAMAMDGGASTSINYKNIEIFSSDNNERKVKSFLVIEN